MTMSISMTMSMAMLMTIFVPGVLYSSFLNPLCVRAFRMTGHEIIEPMPESVISIQTAISGQPMPESVISIQTSISGQPMSESVISERGINSGNSGNTCGNGSKNRQGNGSKNRQQRLEISKEDSLPLRELRELSRELRELSRELSKEDPQGTQQGTQQGPQQEGEGGQPGMRFGRGLTGHEGEPGMLFDPAEKGNMAIGNYGFRREVVFPEREARVLQLHPFEVANAEENAENADEKQEDNNNNDNDNDNMKRSCLQRFWQRFCAKKTCPNYISIPSFCAACAVGVLAFTNNNILQVTTANLETANANLEIANAFVVQNRAAWDVCTDQLQAVWDEQRCQFF